MERANAICSGLPRRLLLSCNADGRSHDWTKASKIGCPRPVRKPRDTAYTPFGRGDQVRLGPMCEAFYSMAMISPSVAATLMVSPICIPINAYASGAVYERVPREGSPSSEPTMRYVLVDPCIVLIFTRDPNCTSAREAGSVSVAVAIREFQYRRSLKARADVCTSPARTAVSCSAVSCATMASICASPSAVTRLGWGKWLDRAGHPTARFRCSLL